MPRVLLSSDCLTTYVQLTIMLYRMGRKHGFENQTILSSPMSVLKKICLILRRFLKRNIGNLADKLKRINTYGREIEIEKGLA